MLKTIKVTKKLRLDELLKLCWDNHITSGIYNSNKKSCVRVFDSSNVVVSGRVTANDIFEVYCEEPIREDTKFELLVELHFVDGEYLSITRQNKNISDVMDYSTISIYGLIDGRLELIWERE